MEVARQREVKWLDMFRHWDKWIKHRFQKVRTNTEAFVSVTLHHAAPELNPRPPPPPFCWACAGEVAVQEGDSVFAQSQSLAAAVQQSGPPGSQPWEV